jgi:arsenate reductase
MAHGFLQSLDERLNVFSAGTEPASQVNQLAVRVMHEAGIDISKHIPKNVDIFLNKSWDYVITVCDDANEKCPAFVGKVKNRLHFGFEDPSKAIGNADFVLSEFYRIRNLIFSTFEKFYNDIAQLL